MNEQYNRIVFIGDRDNKFPESFYSPRGHRGNRAEALVERASEAFSGNVLETTGAVYSEENDLPIIYPKVYLSRMFDIREFLEQNALVVRGTVFGRDEHGDFNGACVSSDWKALGLNI